jgi:hexulose-6-phosphate isomerase
MEKGIFQGVFPFELTLDECMSMAKEYGFAGIELCVEPSEEITSIVEDLGSNNVDVANIAKSVGLDKARPGSVRLNSPDSDLIAIREKSERLGVRIHSVLSLLQFIFPITSENAKVREVGIGVAEKLIHIARLLGADTVLFIPGMVTPDVSYEEAYRRSQEVIRYLLPMAEQSGVILAIENVWNKFLLSPLEMRDYIDEFESEWIGVYFDVGNVLNYGYPNHWIKILGSRIKKVHLKDFLLEIGNIHGFTHLFQGDVDWPRVIRALREVGYDGFLTVEVPPYKSYSSETIRVCSLCLDLIIQDCCLKTV